MDSGKLDVLHDSGNVAVCAVRDSICFALCSVVQEAVNEDWSVRCNAYCGIHVDSHHLIVMNDFHSSSAKNVRRTNHYGVADLVCDLDGFVSVDSHTCFRHRDAEAVHHCAEVVSVFSKVDSLRCCT